MAGKDSNTNTEVELNQELEKAKSYLDLASAIAYQAMAARGDLFEPDFKTPWRSENVQENTYKAILKLVGDAWEVIFRAQCNLDTKKKKPEQEAKSEPAKA